MGLIRNTFHSIFERMSKKALFGADLGPFYCYFLILGAYFPQIIHFWLFLIQFTCIICFLKSIFISFILPFFILWKNFTQFYLNLPKL